MSYARPAASSASVSWYGAASYVRQIAAAATAEWRPDIPAGRIAAVSPLGAAMVFAGAAVPIDAAVSAPSPLSAASLSARHDFTGILGDVSDQYVMDLVTPDGAVRVPISSWQATLQAGQKSFAQCVVPACAVWVDALTAATEFVVSRRAALLSGGAIEYEMVRMPMQTLRYDRGPLRYTATISGYGDAFAATGDPLEIHDRELIGRRSNTSWTGGIRVRCAVDWLLRPGHRALVDGVPFVVDYINYFVGGNDSYSDVGGKV